MENAERLVEATVGVPVTSGNTVDVLRNGDEIFPSMLTAIRDSLDSVLLSTYVYWTGEIAQDIAAALAERARNGVKVKVLVDYFGGRLMNNQLIDDIKDAGGEFAWFRPPGRIARAAISLDEGLVGQHRTHRKVLVCDGRVGFTGGVGIAEEWMGDARSPDEWRDTHVRIEGPAVAGLVSAFATNWHEASGDPLPADTVAEAEAVGDVDVQIVRGQPGRFVSDIALVLRALVDAAEERVWVETAYFVPDDELTERLCRAVERGVDVRVLVPGSNIDKRVSQIAARASFEPLMDAGVAVFEFQPTMLHCKVAVIDDVAICGSANLNMRSFGQDDELIAILHHEAIADRLAEDFVADLERSEHMDPARFQQRGLKERMSENAVKMIRRFM